MDEKIRKHMRFYGWVQGVGFRYRARHAAGLVGTTGWVKNEADGSVTLELQGTQEQIDKVIELIQRGRYVEISHVDAKTIPVDPDERSFSVRGSYW